MRLPRGKRPYRDKRGRLVNKYATEDYDNHISTLWGAYGTGHYTKREELYLSFFDKIFENFTGKEVLEVGPGTGKFALALLKTYNIQRYTILDLEKNIKDSKELLGKENFNVEYVESSHYQTLYGKEYDLFVSIMCLSEVPDYYRENLGNNIFPRCKNIYIIDGDSEDPAFDKWMISTVEKNFTYVDCQPSGYYTCLVVSGKKNKSFCT